MLCYDCRKLLNLKELIIPEQRDDYIRELKEVQNKIRIIYEQELLKKITTNQKMLPKYLKRYPKPRLNPILQMAKIDRVICTVKQQIYHNQYLSSSYDDICGSCFDLGLDLNQDAEWDINYCRNKYEVRAKIGILYLVYLYKLKNDFNRFKIDPEELAREAFKPERMMYQLSFDPDYIE